MHNAQHTTHTLHAHTWTLRNGHVEAEVFAGQSRTFPLTRMYMKMRVWNLGPWSHKYYLSSKSKTHVLIQVHVHKWEVRSSQVTTFLSTCLAFSGDTKQELPFPSSIGKILPPSCQKSFQSLLPNLPASRESKHISKRELTQHLKLIKEVPQGPLNRGAHQRPSRNHSRSFSVC